MSVDTTNPISEPRVIRPRLGQRRPAPRAGYAQVFHSRRNDWVVVNGTGPMPITEWIAGGEWTYYEVDTGDVLFPFTCNLPCANDVGQFLAEVSLVWRVLKPQLVVEHKLDNIKGQLKPLVEDRLRQKIAHTDPSRRADAEASVNAELGTSRIPMEDLGLEICRFTVKLSLDRAARDYVDDITSITRQTRVDTEKQKLLAQRMEFYEKALAGGDVKTVALQMAERPEESRELFMRLRDEDFATKNRHLEAFKFLVLSGKLEDYEFDEARSEVFRKIVDDFHASLRSPKLTDNIGPALEPGSASGDEGEEDEEPEEEQ